MSFLPIHLSPSGAEIYYSGAYADATGATGVGGAYRDSGSYYAWNQVEFKNAGTKVSIGGTLPTGSAITSSADYLLAPSVVIGGTTPIGDVRGEGAGYIPQGASSTIVPLEVNELYSGALYVTYSRGGIDPWTLKVGIGTTAPSSYYEGSFTTRDNYSFDTILTVDTGNLNETGLGSGVYTIGESVTLQTTLNDRLGNALNTVSSITQDSFVKGVNVSILNEDRSVLYSGYKTDYQNPSFTFTKQENIDLFGSFTENFGVRFDVQNQDGGTHSTDFLLYGNRLSINKIYVSASGGTYLDENPDNDSGPSTDDITAAGDKLEAVVGFSHRLINTSGTTGAINFNLTFDQSPSFTNYDNLLVFANTGVSSAFDTTTDNLLGTFPLSQLKNQNIRVFPDDGVVEGEANFFKFVASSKIGFYNELFTVGPYTIQPVELGTDPILYNVGEQEIVSGNLSILGEGAGGLYALGASGTGDGQRITGPGHLPYLLSGDAADSITLQQVTDNGNVTTNDITVGGTLDPTAPLTAITNPSDDKGWEMYADGDLINPIMIGKADSNNAGEFVVKDSAGVDSAKLSNTSSKGQLDLSDAAGTSRFTAKVDSNDMGEIELLDSSANSSFKAGSHPTKAGYLTIGDTAGTTRLTAKVDSNNMGEIELLDSSANTSIKAGSDSSKHGFIEIVDASDVVKSKIDANTSNDSYINVPSVGIGTNSVAASNSFEVFGVGALNSTLVVAAGASAGYVGIGSSQPSFPLDASTISKANIAAANSYIYSTGSAIFGGANHIITGDFDVIAGGAKANISGGNFNFIGGGSGINVDHSTYSSSIGGFDNDVFSGSYSVIGGGRSNLISGKASESHSDNSAIFGGQNNRVLSAPYSFIGGGAYNLITGSSSLYSTILGGNANHITNSLYGVILGGDNNKINYANTALAAGNYSIVQSGHHGAFVLSDSRTAEYQSTGGNTLNLRFQSGVFVDTDSGIYINGNPVMTGASDEDTDTLQSVTDRGNTTTTSITSTGPYISGGSGWFSSDLKTEGKLLVGANWGAYDATIDGTLQIKDVDGGTMNGIVLASTAYGGVARILGVNTDHGNSHPLQIGGEYLKFTVNTGTEVEAMRIVQGSDGSGWVGINTDDPDYILDIHTATNDQGIRLYTTPNSRPAAELLVDSAINGNADFRLYHGTVVNTRITSNAGNATYFNAGNVGIARTTANHKLDVSGNIRSTLNNTGYLYLGQTSQGDAHFGGAVKGEVGPTYAAAGKVSLLATTWGAGTDYGLTEQLSIEVKGSDTKEATMVLLPYGGKVGIGITNPDNPLEVSGSDNGIKIYAKSTDRPRLTFDCGGAEKLIVSTNSNYGAIGDSTDTNRYMAFYNGNVGINITDPDEKLEIDGNIKIGADKWYRMGGDAFQIGLDGGNVGMHFHAGSAERMTILYSGNVGIGTDVPSATLDVDGGIKLLDNNYLTWRGSNTRMVANSAYLQIQVAASDTMRLTSAGNVGIGTITPNAKLDVRGDISGSGNFYGTGVGSRITNNGTPYLLSGDAAAALTLQDVCDNGNTTTTAVNITGVVTLANNIYKNRENSYLGLYGGTTDLTNDGFIRLYGNSSYWGKVQTNIGYDASNSKAHWTLNNSTELMTLKGNGYLGIGTINPSGYLHVENGASNQAFSTQGDELIVESSDHGGISILTPDAKRGQLYFNNDAFLRWVGSDDKLSINTSASSTTIAIAESAGDTTFGGSVLGTGAGSRITLSGTPYLLSGDAAAALTLQDVCDNGNVTTTSIGANIITGASLVITGANSTFKAYENANDDFRIGTWTADDISIITNGSRRLTVTDAGDVGIGITSPAELLHVDEGYILADGASTNHGFELRRDANDTFQIRHLGGNFTINNLTDTRKDISIDGDGNVGIGTDVPTELLEVDGNIKLGDGGDRDILGPTNNSIRILSNPNASTEGIVFSTDAGATTGMFIQDGNNVGIGTTDPSELLEVDGNIKLGNGGDRDIVGPTNSSIRILANPNSSSEGIVFSTDAGATTGMFIQDGNNVGIGTNSPSNALDVIGHFSATSKSFVIDHPTKENKKLQYGSLEGPENGVYVRGTTNSKIIELPDYWSELIHEDSITVVLTPIGKKQDLYIKSKTAENVMVGGVEGSYDYVVYGERKDVAKLEIEPLKV